MACIIVTALTSTTATAYVKYACVVLIERVAVGLTRSASRKEGNLGFITAEELFRPIQPEFNRGFSLIV